jgi:hypothetical protein
MTCPGFQQLLDFVDGRLDQAAADAVSAHLDTRCSQCEADCAWYLQVKLAAASDDSIEPPAWVFKRALRIFDAPRAQTTVARKVSRVVASLVFDSLKHPAPAGARSSGVEGRQMLYRGENYSIDVQVLPSDQSSADLTGQILKEGEAMFESVAGRQLDLLGHGEKTLSTVTNERGEFRIAGVEFGSYDLRVDVNEVSITIVGLPVGQ